MVSSFALSAADIFLSTHPVRGATVTFSCSSAMHFISIHAPREGCDWAFSTMMDSVYISIHAPREGCDGNGC